MRIAKRVMALSLLALLSAGCSSIMPLEAKRQPYIVSKLQKPQMCVALSGGGLRSAATSIGVLQSLNQSVGLKNVDVVSSTSGGGWAQYWLHAQLAQGRSMDEVLGLNGNEATRDIERLEQASFMDYVGKSAMFLGARSTYYALIRNKFALKPNLFSGSHNLQIDEVQQNVLSKGAPVPIFILSTFSRCGRGDDAIVKYGREGQKLENRLLELMPIGDHMIEVNPVEWGSVATGYGFVYPYELKEVADWATLASAATDTPGIKGCQLVKTLFSTGTNLTTPSATNVDSVSGKKKIFVADGGFADNLALQVLIDRGCRSVLVVDAEQDQGLIFEAYQRVRNNLLTQGKKLIVPKVEDWLASNEGKACQGRRARDSCFVTRDGSNQIVLSPIMPGCVTTGDSCESPASGSMQIQYLKLTLDPAIVESGQASAEVVSLYKDVLDQPRCRHLTDASPGDCKFPHTPTFVTEYSESLFRAHRLLGYDLMQLHFNKASYLTESRETPPSSSE